MSEFELHQLIYEAIGEARSNFDFWLTITLATLAGGHFAFRNLNRLLRTIVVSTYSAVACAFLLRWLDAGTVVARYTDALQQLNAALPFEGPLSAIAFPLQTLIIIGASVATIYYLIVIAPNSAAQQKHD